MLEKDWNKMINDLYKNHGNAIFDDDVDIYKLYSDMIDVIKKPVSEMKVKLIDFPLTNVYEAGVEKEFIIYDIICPGISKDQLELKVETDEDRTFLCVKGTPYYNSYPDNIKTEILIESFEKKYDITRYNIEIETIKSIYKDGILSVSLNKKKDNVKCQNFKIKIS